MNASSAGRAKPAPTTGANSIAATDAPPNAIVAPEKSESAGEHKIVSAEHCTTRVVKGHRRRRCEPDRAERRERGGHVRSVDRRVSREGHGARHHGGNLHTRHARGTSGHHGT